MIKTKEQAQEVLKTLHMPIDAAEEYARLILDAVRLVRNSDQGAEK